MAGAARGVIADSVAAFLIFIRTRYSMFEARQWEEEHQHRISPVFRDLHFTNIHRFLEFFFYLAWSVIDILMQGG